FGGTPLAPVLQTRCGRRLAFVPLVHGAVSMLSPLHPFAFASRRHGSSVRSRRRFYWSRGFAGTSYPARRGALGLVVGLIVLGLQGVAPIRADDAVKPRLLGRIEAGKSVGRVRFSPDGKSIALVDECKHLIICDTNNRKVQAVFSDVARNCTRFCFTPDGKSVVVT